MKISKLSDIKGLGPKSIECLKNININSIDDLVNYYPYRHDIIILNDIKTAEDKQNVIIECIVDSVPIARRFRANMSSLTFRAVSNRKMIAVVIFNRVFLKTHIKPGSIITVIGKYDKLKNTVIASDIKFEKLVSGSIESVYHLTSGITQKQIKKYIGEALVDYDNYIDYIPEYLNKKYKFISKKDAVNQIHNPKTEDEVKQALIKLKYEELFEFMFKINYLKKINVKAKGIKRNISDNSIEEFTNKLPFTLTTLSFASRPASAAGEPSITLPITLLGLVLPTIKPKKNKTISAKMKLFPAPKNITKNLCHTGLFCNNLSLGSFLSSSNPSPAN